MVSRKSRFDKQQQENKTSSSNKYTTATTATDGVSNNNSNEIKSDTILFKCNSQNTFGQPNTIELSICNISAKNDNDTVEQNDDKEAIFESQSILINKSILECLLNDYDQEHNVDKINFFPIGVQLAGTVVI